MEKAPLPPCSDAVKKYFIELDSRAKAAHKLAGIARAKGYDPEQKVDIPLTASVPERSEKLIASQFPELENSGAASRIMELEKTYSKGDWRIALTIADEISAQKLCKFKDELTAINAGVKLGFAYLTLGIVAAPLEGLVEIKFKERKDGGKYLALYYSGPVRGAGGTASAVSVMIADYVRIKRGIAKYDITDDEVGRYQTEISDYLRLVGHRQYVPTAEELELMVRNIGVEINGDPTEKYEVSRYKRVDRVETPQIRGGMVLVVTEGPTLKAEKIAKQLNKWGEAFGFTEWNWINDFVKLKKKLHYAAAKTTGTVKIEPNLDYLSDIVAGRPVFGHPMCAGSFRLRYGRARSTGFAAQAMHPATLRILNDYVATGTQIKVERPGKATIINPCDSIEGPLVRLKNGDFLLLETEEQADAVRKDIEEITFIGDVLVCYGDFSENGKRLAPAGYCEEWWALELEEAVKKQDAAALSEQIKQFISDPLKSFPTFEQASALALKFKIPLHPRYTFHWPDIEMEQIIALRTWLKSELDIDKDVKRTLELIGCPHTLKDGKIILEKNWGAALRLSLHPNSDLPEAKTSLELVNKLAPVEIRDKSGTYIGMRMGRPEKAKLRKMKGSPHGLFPVGDEGGRTRSIQKAMEVGHVTGDFQIFSCPKCDNRTIYPLCEKCGERATQWFRCPVCKRRTKEKHCHAATKPYERKKIDVNYYVENAKNYLKIRQLAPLIKGIRGTSNKDHIPENFCKAILRAKHDLNVNKDGTIRYDMTETATTHFKPVEIGTPVKRLRELGYAKDIYGKELASKDQLLEILPQDVILPACAEAEPDGADQVLFRVTKFVDDLLVRFYHQEPYFNLKQPSDLVGVLVIGLAPHTSGGIIGRIIGFSKTQGCYSHPYWHAAQRRNLDGDETCVMLLMDAFLNFSRQYLPDRRGSRSVSGDTIVFIEKEGKLQAAEISEIVDAQIENRHVNEEGYEIARTNPDGIKVLAFNNNRTVRTMPVSAFIRHKNDKQMFRIKTTNGAINVTGDHSLFITRGKDILSIPAREMRRGDAVITLDKLALEKDKRTEIDVLELLGEHRAYIVPEECNLAKIREQKIPKSIFDRFGLNNVYRYKNGMRAAPYAFYKSLHVEPTGRIRLKAQSLSVPRKIPLTTAFFRLLGYALSEGYFGANGLEITNTNSEIIDDIRQCCVELFKEEPHIRIDKRSHKYSHGICYNIRIPLIFQLVLERMGVSLVKSGEKEIPDFVFRTSKDNIAEFLDAYVRGDGTQRKDYVTIFTSSRKLAAGMALLARLSGLKSGVSEQKEMYEISIAKQKLHDPYWPLWDYARELYGELRRAGLHKQEISPMLSNIRKNVRMKTSSKEKIRQLIAALPSDSYLATEFKNILASDIKTERVVAIKKIDYHGYVYDFEVPKAQNFLCGPHVIFAHNSMDAPLVLTTILNPEEVDDEVHGMDIAHKYSLDFYNATLEAKWPWDTKVRQVAHVLGTPAQYEGIGFTHSVSSLNAGVRVSAYKFIPTMVEKLDGQIDLARKIRAVDLKDVGRLVIEKHFIKDIKGNLRKWSLQQYRCIKCNAKYRRTPLAGRCTKCSGRLIFTISEGGIRKYVNPSIKLANECGVDDYLKQTLMIIERRLAGVFGVERTKPLRLDQFFK